MALFRRSEQLVKYLRLAASPCLPNAVLRTIVTGSLQPQVSSLSAAACALVPRGWAAQTGLPSRLQHLAMPWTTLPGMRRMYGAAVQETEPMEYVYVSLNNIADNPGATKQPRRVGRGIGSGRGKTCGRGHKGQKARSGSGPKLGFEGGQTPLRIRAPKKGPIMAPKEGSVLAHMQQLQFVTLRKLKKWIKDGRLPSDQTITMKMLRDSGCARKKIDYGIKLLGSRGDKFNLPVNIEVSAVTEGAKEAIEQAGGTVTTVYYNPLALRALLKPEWFEKKGRRIPRVARPPPKLAPLFDRMGTLPDAEEPAAAAATEA